MPHAAEGLVHLLSRPNGRESGLRDNIAVCKFVIVLVQSGHASNLSNPRRTGHCRAETPSFARSRVALALLRVRSAPTIYDPLETFQRHGARCWSRLRDEPDALQFAAHREQSRSCFRPGWRRDPTTRPRCSGDPWDMCNPEDMSLRPDERIGFSSFSFLTGPCRAGGTTMAVNGANDSSVMMLSPGIYDVALNPGRNGRNFPIDSSKYQVLSFKLYSSATEDPQIWWFHNPANHPSGLGLGGRVAPRTSPGTQLIVADLTQSLLSWLFAVDKWSRSRAPTRSERVQRCRRCVLLLGPSDTGRQLASRRKADDHLEWIGRRDDYGPRQQRWFRLPRGLQSVRELIPVELRRPGARQLHVDRHQRERIGVGGLHHQQSAEHSR